MLTNLLCFNKAHNISVLNYKKKIMNYKIICTLFLFINALSLSAQTQLKGKVIDDVTGMGIASASITDGKDKGTSTDENGMFSLACNGMTQITVSTVGYETKRLNIKNCSDFVSIRLSSLINTLGQVEVTATSTQNKSLLYQPASITKLTPLEINRNTGLYFDDAINTNVPGVQMNRRSVGGGQQLNIRGYGNGSRGTRGVSSNFDGQGYKLYLNGIPITDAEGITTFDDIDFASIGNVEVTKGPAGTLYGLAIAGAVNLSTIKATPGQTSIAQELQIGNYGLLRTTTQLALGKVKSSVLVNYGHQKSDGYSIHNASRKDFVNFAGDFKPNEKQNITSYVGYSDSYDERFGELTLAQYEANDYSGNINYIKNNAHSNVITFRAGLGHNYYFTKNISNSTTIFGTGLQSNASSAGGWTDKNSLNYGLRSAFNTKFNLGSNVALSGITGIETQRQDAQALGYNMKADPKDPNPSVFTYGVSPYWIINATTANVFYKSTTTSLFTQWTLALPQDFAITAGIGSSNMVLNLNDRLNPGTATKPSRFQKRYNDMLSPSFAINKVFNKHVSAYASYSKGYKAPVSSFFYITTPAVTSTSTPATSFVNDGLKAEIGNQYEIGTKGQLLDNKLNFELAYFNAVFSNKFTAISVASPASANTTLYSYVVNGGKQIHDGVEASVKYNAYQSENSFVTSIRPFANFTYSDFKYGDNFKIQKSVTLTEDYSNKQVAGVPKYIANFGLDFTIKTNFYGNITYNYRDKIAVTSLNDVYTKSYNLLNAKIGYRAKLSNHFDLDIFAGGQNLTNTKYFIMVFVNQLADAYIPAPKTTNFYSGINLKYNF